MKYKTFKLIFASLLVMSITAFPSCDSSSSTSDETEAAYTDLKVKYSELMQELGGLREELNSTKDERDSLKSDYSDMEAQSNAMQEEYQSLLDDMNNGALKNPTWAKLKRFLETDPTDTREYISDVFDCEGFTITLRDNAWRRGYRCGYVAIGFGEGVTGHALNVFETTDEGLIYVDAQHDSIGYVEEGEIYGAITIEAVKSQGVNCDMFPEEFWKPITYKQSKGSMFSYQYYKDYQVKTEFYSASLNAYNDDVTTYNTAVNVYNHGGGSYSPKELNDWGDKLETWSDNINILSDDLGSVRVEPMGIVSAIETYWN